VEFSLELKTLAKFIRERVFGLVFNLDSRSGVGVHRTPDEIMFDPLESTKNLTQYGSMAKFSALRFFVPLRHHDITNKGSAGCFFCRSSSLSLLPRAQQGLFAPKLERDLAFLGHFSSSTHTGSKETTGPFLELCLWSIDFVEKQFTKFCKYFGLCAIF